MAQHLENRPIDDAVELLKVNGFDGLANAVTVLLNAAEEESIYGPLPSSLLNSQVCEGSTLAKTSSGLIYT